MDSFLVVAWANEALDQVRRQVWNKARRAGHTNLASALSGARFALRENPENLTQSQTLGGHLKSGAASTDRRNGSAEQLRWFHPSEGLSRAVVELAGHRGELGA